MWGTPHRSRITSTGPCRPRTRRVPSTCGNASRACSFRTCTNSSTTSPLLGPQRNLLAGNGTAAGRSGATAAICGRSAGTVMMAAHEGGEAMTDHRPWFASYPEGVPHTVEPLAEKSQFTALEDTVRMFPDRPALAWFGKHVSYRELLQEVERFSA